MKNESDLSPTQFNATIVQGLGAGAKDLESGTIAEKAKNKVKRESNFLSVLEAALDAAMVEMANAMTEMDDTELDELSMASDDDLSFVDSNVAIEDDLFDDIGSGLSDFDGDESEVLSQDELISSIEGGGDDTSFLDDNDDEIRFESIEDLKNYNKDKSDDDEDDDEDKKSKKSDDDDKDDKEDKDDKKSKSEKTRTRR